MAIWEFLGGQNRQETIGWQTFGTTALVGIASAAVGALLGFIFGIPITLDPEGQALFHTERSLKEDRSPARKQRSPQIQNLERVSDWLTTLLIGATLVPEPERHYLDWQSWWRVHGWSYDRGIWSR